MAKSVIHATRIPKDLYEKLRIMAERDRRSINGEMVAIIEATIADYERRNGPIAVTPPDNAPTPG